MDKSKYFFRTVVFSKLNKQVSLVDLYYPEEKTPPLDSWLGVIVLLADGQHTIAQLIEHMTAQYKGAPPDNLEKTIESAMQRLIETEVVRLSENPIDLPYYLSTPAEKLDIDMAKSLMEKDGYNVKGKN